MVYCRSETLNKYVQIKEFDEDTQKYKVKIGGQAELQEVEGGCLSLFIEIQIKTISSKENSFEDITTFRVKISDPIKKIHEAFFGSDKDKKGCLIHKEKTYSTELQQKTFVEERSKDEAKFVFMATIAKERVMHTWYRIPRRDISDIIYMRDDMWDALQFTP